ncbi:MULTISPECIES: MliC family protein [Pseudomonas]|uniref:MliC family protein n=1 Tax=Pseudomonas TaxID=286 RepID=UPI0006419DCF|nr:MULTISPECIES: MliC family protein [Pseudomonas]MCO7573331.1 MliC family protein [Pseudomonas chlororaphis]MCO7591275.1 MliC family protein [Pseudomonas chlororaphis]MDP9526209.1 MliC family protein [Pseudomonas protegens]
MKTRLATLCAVALASALPILAEAAQAQSPAPEPTYQSQVARYRCEGNVRIEAAYLNIDNGTSFATLHYKDQLIPMHIARSGSGALYIADDEQNSFRWHTKGKQGVLSFLEADHTAEEETLLKDCQEIDPQ